MKRKDKMLKRAMLAEGRPYHAEKNKGRNRRKAAVRKASASRKITSCQKLRGRGPRARIEKLANHKGGTMFEQMKRISNQISRKMGIEFSKQFGMKLSDVNQPEELKLREGALELLSKKWGIKPEYGPVRTGLKGPDGREREVVTFTQTFSKEAPELSKFITELNRCFVIEHKGGMDFEVRSATLADRFPPCLAGYFVQGEKTFAVDLETGEPMTLEGYQEAGKYDDPSGKILIEVNLEYALALKTLIHELIHAKTPEEIPQYLMVHAQIDNIAKEIELRIKHKIIKDPISEIDGLKRERQQIQRVFEEFEKELRGSISK